MVLHYFEKDFTSKQVASLLKLTGLTATKTLQTRSYCETEKIFEHKRMTHHQTKNIYFTVDEYLAVNNLKLEQGLYYNLKHFFSTYWCTF